MTRTVHHSLCDDNSFQYVSFCCTKLMFSTQKLIIKNYNNNTYETFLLSSLTHLYECPY